MTLNNILPLPDDRCLSYAEYGLPNGKPVFLFHGMPGSRFFRPSDEITTQMGVRLITVDRPGYGRSDFQPGRRLLDWPTDIARLADHLNLERFAVAAHSGGGPHAAACAYALPERITAAALVSSMGPLDAPGASQGMKPINWFGLAVGSYLPWPLWQALIWLFYHRRRDDPAGELARGSVDRPAADEAQINRPEVLEACIRSEVEGSRHGLRGLAWDSRLLTRPWGFRLADIRVPVYLWHGNSDNQVTMGMARYMAGQIPNCKATFCKGEGHLLIFPRWKEILTQLVSE